jgi:signal transduction histidine kinase/AmiR/NasT family two-component response regulator
MDEWIDHYVLPEAREATRRTLHADVAAWVPETLMTLPVRADDGTQRWVRAWTRRDLRGGQRIAMGMHLDVTEQVRQEALQREAERAARASREKSEFMAMMSHRLRTPLNAVLGFAQLLAQDPLEPLSERQRERLARIDAAGAELLSMIDDVFELAALEAGGEPPAPAPVALESLIAGLREAVEPLARLRGVALHLPPVVPAVQVATDRRLLGQALRHLAAHAVRRSERGGHVALDLAIAPPWVQLVLRDGGPGLSAAQRELLFDAPGPRADDDGHGDPLVGLALVRQAMERLGAQVDWLVSDPADSALQVRLPMADDARQAPPTAGLTVLCIEDNPVNLMLVQELVAMRPQVRLLTATDGGSGLALAERERPDLVLLDLHLPDLHGREVAACLRADPRTAGCCIVALSAGALPEEMRAARAQGFDDYWTKPIDFDRFLAGLDRIAAERAGRTDRTDQADRAGPATAPGAP